MRAVDRGPVDKEDVRHMTGEQFARLGVRLINRVELMLECKQCGEHWKPQLGSGGKLPFDYWVCPARCNADHPAHRASGGTSSAAG